MGTKSVLFGAHCFFIHPWFVALAWWRLYGFPSDFRLWVAFFVHDLGYWGKTAMDSPEGESHPLWGANLMRRWFGQEWGDFCLLHSRFYAKQLGRDPSALCAADKLAVALEPWWLYLPRVILTGEVHEYMKDMAEGKYSQDADSLGERVADRGYRAWWHSMTTRCRNWAMLHAYDLRDTVTYAREGR